ncbi:hypothetical protein B7P43_G18456, partial [Cryptotermes secundus]
YITFRRDRNTRVGGVFVCVENYIACVELWVDENFEMIAVEVKGRDPKFTWEIVGIYRVALLDIHLARCENLFASCSIIQGIMDRCGGIIGIRMGRKILSTSNRKSSPGVQQSRCYRPTNFFRDNLQYGQAMVVVLRKYGTVFRTLYTGVSKALFGINY